MPYIGRYSIRFDQRNSGNTAYTESFISGSNLILGTDSDGKLVGLDPSGSSTYTNSTPVPTTIGGIEANSTFNQVPITEMFDLLLYPYQSPSFTSFGFGQTSPIEVGTTINSGSKNFTWATSNSTNIQANSVVITDFTNNVVLGTGLANDGSEALTFPTAITKTTNTSNTWKIEGTNTHATLFSRTSIINWYWKLYYGEHISSSLTTSSDILGLRVNELASNSPASYVFIADAGKYKYISYPTSYTLLTSFKDPSTLLDVAMESPTIVSVTNTLGVTTNYYVHRTTNKLGGAITITAS